MSAGAGGILHIVTVGLKALVSHIGVKRCLGDRKKLRCKKRQRRFKLGHKAYAAVLHGLILRVAVVAAFVKRCVKIRKLSPFRHGKHLVESIFKALRARAKRTFKRNQCVHISPNGLISTLPCLFIGKYMGKIPHKPGVHLLAYLKLHSAASVWYNFLLFQVLPYFDYTILRKKGKT
jgi:hypothetical protein